jgi:hypothetical protein
MKNKIIKYIILFSNLNKKKIKVLKENFFFFKYLLHQYPKVICNLSFYYQDVSIMTLPF